MSVSMRDLDPAFQGAGQKAGIEIWRIENFCPVAVPKSSHGKFITGDSYVILKTTALKSGALHHDIHYWLGKDTSQDEAGAAAIKTVELDAALGGRAVQYREVQGHETEKFLSYFKPCIMPQEGGVVSRFKHVAAEEHETRLFACKGKHVVRVKEVPFARSSLNHDDIFILDTKSKIFQFNSSNSSIQERAKALEVVQYIKDTYHDGQCEIAAIGKYSFYWILDVDNRRWILMASKPPLWLLTAEDGKLMADADTGEFWNLFGGFAPLPRKTTVDEPKSTKIVPSRLYCVEKGEAVPIQADTLRRDLLDTHRCYILDCGTEAFVWMGRSTSLNSRKAASSAVDELLRRLDRSISHVTHVIEGFETISFRSKFGTWTQSNTVAVSEDGRGRVASLLKRQGINVKGLLKAESPRAEPQPHIDCTGNLQVWRVDGQQKTCLSGIEQSKFYSGDCYIFQYSYSGEEKEEHLIGAWLGKQSVEEDRATANSLASKMVEAMKFMPTQVRIHEGSEPIRFFAIFQCFIVFKGGLSKGYKNYIAENELPDDTYTEDGFAFFRVQGSGPENMQAIQVEPVASSLNSSYCYILQSGSSVFTWSGNLTSSEAQELAERLLDLMKPNEQPKLLKEGAESERFWEFLGAKSEYPSQKITREAESDPHLFSCTISNGELKVTEVYNFNHDDLMTEDIFILDCHSDIYVWVGQLVKSKTKTNALNIGEKFLERDFVHEKLSLKAPVYIVMERGEPNFFTRFFSWDYSKSAMRGNSFQRKMAIVKNGGPPMVVKPKRRAPVLHSGRSAVPDKSSQRSRSMSFSPDRVRARGRSPAFNALAAHFENPNARNLSTPPPIVRTVYPKSVTPDSGKLAPRSVAIAKLSSTFEQPPPARLMLIPHSPKVSPELTKPKSGMIPRQNSIENNEITPENAKEKPKPQTIPEDVKENEPENDEGLPVYPYERLKTSSIDPVPDIDVTKRETYLSSAEFKEKFRMSRGAFYEFPKWKQNKLKMSLKLF